jgi:DNA-binding XRE family transcriptional regulator
MSKQKQSKTQEPPVPELEKIVFYRDSRNRATAIAKAPTLKDLEAELLDAGVVTHEEVSESNARVAIMVELVKARNERRISQRKLEELTGVRKSTIARIETGSNSPTIDTMLKVLAPLGKTLAVVPIEPTQTSKDR